MVSLRDIVKSITQSVRNATPDSEGQAALDVIEQFIDEQTSANIGDSSTTININDIAAVDKLSQEVLHLYEATIGTDEATAVISCRSEVRRIHAQHYILLRSLRALLPIIRPVRLFEEWWPHLKPILTSPSYTILIKKETRLIISDALILEQELLRIHEIQDCMYFHRIVNTYLEWAESVYQRQEAERDETTIQHQALLDLEQDEWSKNLTMILLSVGALETKVIMASFDRGHGLTKSTFYVAILSSFRSILFVK